MRAFFHFPLGRAEKVEGVKKIKLGRNEGRGAGLVAGTGEPEAAQERESRGGCCWGQIAGAVQARESRGGAVGGRLPGRRRNGSAGAVLPGAARWRAKKNKGKHIFVQAFFNPAYLR